MSSPPTHPNNITPRMDGDPTRIGGYRIVGRIGAGGMGIVYAALAGDDTPIALKVIKSEIADDTDFRTRFAREVALAARVRGTCVPRFFGGHAQAEQPWLATEFVPGLTLRQHVNQHGPLTAEMLTGFAAGMAEALAAVHAAGIVHRDLKPGNIILSPSGPKVLDFGIARAVELSAITRSGDLVGTPGWIAPELYLGAQADTPADMFAWGGLVAFAATGRNPFGKGDTAVLAQRAVYGTADVDGVPEDVMPLVQATLAKDPEQRPSASDVLRSVTDRADTDAQEPPDALAEMLHGGWQVQTDRADVAQWKQLLPRRRRTVTVSTAVMLVLLLVLAGGWTARDYLGAPPDPLGRDSDSPGITTGADNGGNRDTDPPVGTQELRYNELTMHIPEEWIVHERVEEWINIHIGQRDPEDVLLVQTDPNQECEVQDTGIGDPGCVFFEVLGPVSRQFGNGLSSMDESMPFARGLDPSYCREHLDARPAPEEPQPVDPLVAEDMEISGQTVPYRTWQLACSPEGITFESDMLYFEQRLWHFPESLVVDDYQTPGLDEMLREAVISR